MPWDVVIPVRLQNIGGGSFIKPLIFSELCVAFRSFVISAVAYLLARTVQTECNQACLNCRGAARSRNLLGCKDSEISRKHQNFTTKNSFFIKFFIKNQKWTSGHGHVDIFMFFMFTAGKIRKVTEKHLINISIL